MTNNRMDWIVFERMVSLYEHNSCCVYSPSYASFICFKRVDWQRSEREQPLNCIYQKPRTLPDWLAPSKRTFISVFGSCLGLSLVAVSDFGEGSVSKKSAWRAFDCAQPMERRFNGKGCGFVWQRSHWYRRYDQNILITELAVGMIGFVFLFLFLFPFRPILYAVCCCRI